MYAVVKRNLQIIKVSDEENDVAQPNSHIYLIYDVCGGIHPFQL